MQSRATVELLIRVRSEYIEMPGLSLTSLQAQRLWNLAQIDCDDILSALVNEGFLNRTAEGAYLRTGGEPRASHLTGSARAVDGGF